MTGRPTKLTADVATAIVKAIRAGNYPEVAAACNGVSRSAYYEWMQRGDRAAEGDELFTEFADAVTRARAWAERKMVGIVRRDAAANPDSARWFLERSMPERWGRRDHVVVETRVQEELNEALDKLQRDLTPDAYAQVVRSLAGGDDAGAGPAPPPDAPDE